MTTDREALPVVEGGIICDPERRTYQLDVPDDAAALAILINASSPYLPEYPFLEQGKIINGQHWYRGAYGWVRVPDPRTKFLEPAKPRRRWRLWRRAA